MIIAIPVEKNNGLDSNVFAHFGMAGEYLVVDAGGTIIGIIPNKKLQDPTVHCKSGRFTKKYAVDTVLTLCIGNGQLRNLTTGGIQVLKAVPGTIRSNLELIEKGEIKPFHMFDICRGERNKKEGGCGHHH